MAKTARTATKKGQASATTKRGDRTESKDKRAEKSALPARIKKAPRKIKAAARPPIPSSGKLATSKRTELEAGRVAAPRERRAEEAGVLEDDDAPPDSIQIQDLAQVVRRVLARGKLSASRIVVAKDKLTVEIPRRAVEKLAL
jgi:hypothetical protein